MFRCVPSACGPVRLGAPPASPGRAPALCPGRPRRPFSGATSLHPGQCTFHVSRTRISTIQKAWGACRVQLRNRHGDGDGGAVEGVHQSTPSPRSGPLHVCGHSHCPELETRMLLPGPQVRQSQGEGQEHRGALEEDVEDGGRRERAVAEVPAATRCVLGGGACASTTCGQND